MHPTPISPRDCLHIRAALVAITLGMLAAPSTLRAQTIWSTTASTGNMSTGANWSGGSAPVDNTAWAFGTSTNTTLTNNFSAYTVTGITFNSGASAYTLSGNAFTLSGNITNNSSSTQAINNALTLSGNNTMAANSGAITLGGVLSGSGNLVKSGTSTLTLSGNNTYTGKTAINGGTLSIAGSANLGAAPGSFVADQLTLNGGTLTATAYTTWNATRGITLGAGGGVLNTSSTIDANTGNLISGSGSLTKNGSGTLALSFNTYSGGLILNQGTLHLRNNSTDVGGVVTQGVAGTGTFTINGGALQGSGFTANLNANQWLINGNFSVNPGAADANKLQIRIGGQIDLAGGTRTVSLGRYTTPANISSANSALRLSSFNATHTTSNGTFRFVRDSGGTASNFAALELGNMSFASSATLAIGTNVIAIMPGYNNPFGTDAAAVGMPHVSVEADGYLNLSDNATAASSRNLRIRTLSGAGVVTNLATSGTSFLSVNPQSGESSTFSGRILDGSSLNATLGTSSAGVVALSKNGSGTLVLSGNNTYSGTTAIEAGVLNIQHANALGSTTAGTTVASGAALQLQGGLSVGAESLSLNGAGVSSGGALRNISGNNSWAGAITLAGATRIHSDADLLTLSGGISGTQNLTVGGSGNTTISGAIATSTGTLTKDGIGTLTLSGNNTYSGTTAIEGGVFLIDGSGRLGGGSYSGGIINNGTLNYSGTANQTLGGVLSGSGNLVKSGTSTLTLNGTNTYTGKTAINGGTLSIAGSANLGAAPGSFVADQLTLNGGTLTATAYTTWNATRGITLGAGGGVLNTSNTLDANTANLISGSGSLTKNGSGTLALSYNTYSGGLILNQGTLHLRNNSTDVGGVVTQGVAGTGTFTINGGALQGSGFTTYLNANQWLINGNFSVNPGAADANKQLIRIGGQIDLAGGTRTVSLGRYTTPANISSANSALRLSSFNATHTTSNGTFRFVRDSGGTASDYAALELGNMSFASSATLAIGANVITVMPGFNNPFGTDAAAVGMPHVSVEADGYLNLSDNASGASSRNLRIRTLSGAGVVTNLATSGTSTLSVNPQSGESSTFSGRILDGSSLNATLGTSSAGVVALSKIGAGTLILSGNNTYSGTTGIEAGVLNIQHANALGSTTAGTTVASGAVLQLQGGLSVGAESLSLNGTGVSSDGALRNISGNNSWAGAITLAGTTLIHSDADLLTLSGGISGTQNLTVGGSGNTTISGAIATSTGTLTKDGAGTLTLSATNSYTGSTTVNAGTLVTSAASQINSSSALVVNGGMIQLGGDNTVAGLSGSGGTVDVNQSRLTVNASTNSTFSGNLIGNRTASSGGSSLTKQGAGTLTLTGVVDLSASDAIATGANQRLFITAGELNFAGSGTNTFNNLMLRAQGGTLRFSSGVNTISKGTVNGELVADSGGQIIVDGGNVTAVGASLGFGGSGTNMLTINGGSLTIGSNGTGSILIGNNVSGGTNLLNLNGGTLAVHQSLVNGGNPTSANQINFNGGTLQAASANFSISSSANTAGLLMQLLVGNGGAIIDTNGFNATVPLALTNNGTGGLTKLGAGTLTLSANNTYAGATTVSAGTLTLSGGSAIVDSGAVSVASGAVLNLGASETVGTIGGAGSITLGNYTLTSNASSDTTFSGVISGTGGALTKAGSGTLTLSGNNTYTGATAISAGVLNIQQANALGTTAAGTTVSSGAALQLQGGLAVGAEALSLNGTGVSSDGALRNISGNNSYAGAITLAGATRIHSDADLLTLSGSVSGTQNLTVGGSGNITISGAIATSTGTLTKDGNGTLTLSATNSYTGSTTVNAGTLVTSAASRINSSSALVVNGGTIQLGGDNTVAGLSGSGGTVDVNQSRLTVNTSTSSTFSGNLIGNRTVSSGGSSLTKQGAGTLTLSGTVNLSASDSIAAGGNQRLFVTAGELNFAGSGTNTFNNLMLRAQGGTLRFSSGVNTISKGTVNGDLVADSGGQIIVDGGTVTAVSASLGFGGNGTNSLTINGGSLTIGANGTGSINIGNNVNGGANILNLNGGTLAVHQQLANGGAAGLTTANQINFNGGTLQAASANFSIAGGANTAGLLMQLLVGNGGAIIDTNGFNATVPLALTNNGTGGLTKLGAGTLTLSANNTYAGATTVSAGTLTLSGGSAIVDSGAVSVESGAVLNLGASETVGTIGGAGSITLGNYTLTSNASSDTTFSGVISGTGGALTKAGSGTLTLSGNNTYTGNTVITSGTLTAAHAGALGSNSTVQVTGGTLLVTADDALEGKNITLNTQGVGLQFSGNYSGSIGSLTLSANSSIDLGPDSVRILIQGLDLSTYTLSLYNWSGLPKSEGGTGADTDKVFLLPAIDPADLNKISFYSGNYGTDSFLGTGYDLGLKATGFTPAWGYQIIPVPEAETWMAAVLILVGMGIAHMQKRRRHQK